MRKPKSFLALFGVVVIILTAFQNCADFTEPQHDAASLDSSKLSGFTAQILPILRTNCAACHGNAESPLFAVTNAAQAYEAAFPVINWNDPASSTIVRQIQAGSPHPGGSYPAIATQLQTAIQNVANGQ